MEFSASALNGTVRVAMVGRSDCAFAVDGAHQRPANCRDAYTTFATAFTQLLPGVKRFGISEVLIAHSGGSRGVKLGDSVPRGQRLSDRIRPEQPLPLHRHLYGPTPRAHRDATELHRPDRDRNPDAGAPGGPLRRADRPAGLGDLLPPPHHSCPRHPAHHLVRFPQQQAAEPTNLTLSRRVTRRRPSLNGRWLLFLLAFSKLLILLSFRGVLVKLFNRLPGTRIRLPEDGLLDAALSGDVGLVTDSRIYLRMLRLSDKPAWRRLLQEGRVRFLVNAREAVSLTPARRVYLGNSILINLLMPAETCNPQTVPLFSFPRLYVVAYSRFRQRSLPEFFEQASTLTRQDVFRRRPFPKLCLSKPYPEQATWAQVRLIFTVFLGAMGGNALVLLAEELLVLSAFVRAHAKLMLP